MRSVLCVAAAVLLWSALASAESPLREPVLRIAAPDSLESLIHFAPPDPKLHILRRGDIWWRANIDLPPHASVDRVLVLGYDPVILKLKDGRCFKIQLDGDVKKLTKAQVSQADCPTKWSLDSSWPAPVPRPGMHYVGRGWDLDGWFDERTGKTVLTRASHQNDPPLLATDMRVVGLGALGAPDAPMTEVSLVGYVGRQLTIATVMLYYP